MLCWGSIGASGRGAETHLVWYAVWDKEQLVEHVMQAKDDYPAEKLAEMWDYKSYVMEAVEACDGGNDYPRHRPKGDGE